MANSVEMPELGESVTEGTITQWLKSVGDTVEVDEPLLEVSTDKVDTEIPSPVAGTIIEIKADEDDTIEVGEVIAIIGDEDEAGSASNDSSADKDEEEAEEAQEESKADSSNGGSGDASDVEMPELGESVTEGTITQWLKSVGDTVDVGAVIAVVGDGDAAADESDDSSADESDEADEADEDSKASESKDTESKDSEKEESSSASESGSDKGSSEGSSDVTMPELGESVTEGTITQWLKEVGDEVSVDEPLLEVSTDKVDTEIPSPVAGTLVEILADEDDTIEVGAVIARIGDENATASSSDSKPEPQAEEKKEEEKKEEPKAEEDKKPEPKAEDKKETQQDSSLNTSAKVNNGDNVPYVTPLVRKLADKHGVDLNNVEGTGVGGRIRKQDVLAAAGEGDAPAKSGAQSDNSPRARWSTKSVDPAKQELIGTTQKVNRIREITASKMVEALQISAQLTHVQEVDMTAIWDMRKKNKQAFIDKHGANLSFLPFIVKATAEALVSHPNVNASYNPETKEMTYHADVNIAIAVDTPKGLLTPVIHKAQDMTLPQIAQQIAELADKARNNKLKPNDLTGATFTVTNIGSEGAMLDTPILVPPQAGILGTAAIEKRPVVVNENGQDAIAIRQMCYLPFTYDHQVVDGADAGRFITTIKDRLQIADFQADLEV